MMFLIFIILKKKSVPIEIMIAMIERIELGPNQFEFVSDTLLEVASANNM